MKLNKQQLKELSAAIALIALLVMQAFGLVQTEQPEARVLGGGTSNFTNLDASGTLTVDGASTLTGAVTVTGALTANGDATLGGTTPLLTVGDAGAEDAAVVFDGNAQDFYIGLDDTDDDLKIGLGSALGTTAAISVSEGLDVTFGSSLALTPDPQTLVAGSIISSTETYALVTSAAAITTSTATAIQAGTITGQLILLRNGNAADAITVDGTGGTVECKADVALGASDTLLLIWNGADWNCLSSYDNS
jgi:hypothetical protein